MQMSSNEFLSTIESALLSPSTPSASQRVELLHSLKKFLPSIQSLLSYPSPKQSDRALVQSKEVKIVDSAPIGLDSQDVQIALKLSDDLNLNELYCVQLLVSVNQKWGLMGREPVEILRLAAGLWYTERRNFLTALYMLFRAVVLDQGYEDDFLSNIQNFLEDLLNNGLRKRIISLIKELNREEPSGLGGPHCETYVLDDRGAVVERRAVVCSERLILVHCLVLSSLILSTGPDDVKDIFGLLKDNVSNVANCEDTVKHQISHGLLFALVITLMSDALGNIHDKFSTLSSNVSFKKEFHETVTAAITDSTLEGFVGVVRLAWSVHLMLMHDGNLAREGGSMASSNDLGYINMCLELAFSKNVFQFLLDNIIRTAAYATDDEDMLYMYNAYLHKLITCFLSQPLARDKVKAAKDSASVDHMYSENQSTHQVDGPLAFVSLLEFISELYQTEPEFLSGNDVIWTFTNFAGEDHTNYMTLVAFINMLATLAYNFDGAKKVYELLQGKTFRAVGWKTLFDCLNTYDSLFKEALQTPGAMLPAFPEADAKALVAYLNILRKVVENGAPVERLNWFSNIEPLFKLLSYENVPSYVKGALRDAIATFIRVSPSLKDSVWSYLGQYDLPVVGICDGKSRLNNSPQVYDMQYELNEIEARQERYPSTISFINLLNTLIAEEKDLSDAGRRFMGIFRFIRDHVFCPYPQRAYADCREKWQLVVACLENFNLMMRMYRMNIDDDSSSHDQYQLSSVPEQSAHPFELPVVELMKDFMSGKSVFRNIMGIIVAGVDFIISERSNQMHGKILEKAVQLSLNILIQVFEKDHLSDIWRPLYQPLDVVLAQDPNQIVSLLGYVRYGFSQQIQISSIKILNILSSRMPGLVQLLLRSKAADALVEDCANCLELRSEESEISSNRAEDPAILILQLLIDNVGRPAPNLTHLLLRFDVQTPVELTVLQPKFNYSCLKVILEILEKLAKPDINAPIHEFGLQLLYELCVDINTCGPTTTLLSGKKFHFFVKHLESIGVCPLPKRNTNQTLRISSLHQRAWLLKLLAIELHTCDFGTPSLQEACQSIISSLFSRELSQNNFGQIDSHSFCKSKVLELLEVLQFKPPDISMKQPLNSSHEKLGSWVENILSDPSSTQNGVYHYSERGDRLIELSSFSELLWKKLNSSQPNDISTEAELNSMREAIQNIIKWGWKYNRNIEEQVAQLHMLTGWSLVVEVSVSRRSSLIKNRSDVLYQILDASVAASASPDCSLKMALTLTQVALTCMAKLRDERFLCPAGLVFDSPASFDLLMVKQLSNGACHSILFKLIIAIMRTESSEALRRRQYALMLSYFQYCRHTLDPDIPHAVLQFLLIDGQDSDDVDLQKIDGEQAELAHANFLMLKKEANTLLDLVARDATQGSDRGKAMALYLLDALICIDHENCFLMHLQRKGVLNFCLSNIRNVESSFDHLQQAYIIEAELAILLRICHKYGKAGMHVLFSMGILESINLSKVFRFPGITSHFNGKVYTQNGGRVIEGVDSNEMILTPMLRLAFSFTAMVDSSDIFEVNNKIIREFLGFIKSHRHFFDQVLREDISVADVVSMELVCMTVGILSKVWPHEDNDETGFVQRLFSMMRHLFMQKLDVSRLDLSLEKKRQSESTLYRLCATLSSYLYYLVSKKSFKLQFSEVPSYHSSSNGSQQPTLASLAHFLSTIANKLERSVDEKSQLLCKIRDINELSRQEVDEIIDVYAQQGNALPIDDLQKRRYIAMMEMCQATGYIDQMITLLLLIEEHVLNIILVHSREGYITSDVQSSKHDFSSFWGKLVPSLDQLEHLSEEKIGGNLKLFKRLVASLKEISTQKMVP